MQPVLAHCTHNSSIPHSYSYSDLGTMSTWKFSPMDNVCKPPEDKARLTKVRSKMDPQMMLSWTEGKFGR